MSMRVVAPLIVGFGSEIVAVLLRGLNLHAYLAGVLLSAIIGIAAQWYPHAR